EDVETGRAFFAANSRARIAGTTEGLVKLVFRASDRRLLGAHILREQANELIHVAQALLHAHPTVHQLIDATFNLPTRADACKDAADDALQHLEARAGNEERRRAAPVLANTKRIVMPARRTRALRYDPAMT